MDKKQSKPNTGVLFEVTEKKSDSHPDRTGSFNIDGIEYWLDGWINVSAAGQRYLSLKVKPKQAATIAPAKPVPDSRNGAAFDDEIPFAAMDWRV